MIKIPSLRSIERVIKMVPVIKDLLPSNSESESGLLQIIKEKNRYIDNKKYDITKLREENADLKQKIKDLEFMLKDLRDV